MTEVYFGHDSYLSSPPHVFRARLRCLCPGRRSSTASSAARSAARARPRAARCIDSPPNNKICETGKRRDGKTSLLEESENKFPSENSTRFFASVSRKETAPDGAARVQGFPLVDLMILESEASTCQPKVPSRPPY